MRERPTGADAGSIPDGVPEGRCGYTLDTDDFYDEFPAVCCYRDVWNETGRCIWHADVEGKPVAELRAARIDRPERLDGATLRSIDADEFDALSGCILLRADLTDADLRGADLTDADLREADLTDTALTNTEAVHARFERAVLTRTDLFDASLTGAGFYGATFDDTKINRGTKLGDHHIDDRDDEDGDDDDDDEATPWDKAAWSYRQLEELAQRNALPEQAREAFERRKDVRRDEYWHDDGLRSWVNWGHSKASSMVMRYGERPWRVVGTSLALIVGFGVAYPFAGGVYETERTGDGTMHALDWLPIPDLVGTLPETVVHLLTSLYFSFVTFTTLGYGDIRPATGAAQFLATIESFLGALLMALLVFVLGRRSTW